MPIHHDSSPFFDNPASRQELLDELDSCLEGVMALLDLLGSCAPALKEGADALDDNTIAITCQTLKAEIKHIMRVLKVWRVAAFFQETQADGKLAVLWAADNATLYRHMELEVWFLKRGKTITQLDEAEAHQWAIDHDLN